MFNSPTTPLVGSRQLRHRQGAPSHSIKRAFTLLPLLVIMLWSNVAWSSCLDRGLQLQILGSGGPGAASGRASASYILWVDGVGRVLVDAGSGTKNSFHQSGALLEDVKLIALSHLHPDHSAELPALLWPAGGAFTIAGPTGAGVFPAIDEFLERLFGPNGIYEVLADRLDLDALVVDATPAEETGIWDENGLLVRALGVPHADVPTLAFRIDLNDHSIAFTSDQNGSDPAIIDFIRAVDVLVIHLGGTEEMEERIAQLHAKPSVWGQMAAAGAVGQVVVSHISTSSPQVLSDSLAILSAHFSGPVTVAEDMMCVEIN